MKQINQENNKETQKLENPKKKNNKHKNRKEKIAAGKPLPLEHKLG